MSTLKQICGDGFCDDAATLQATAIHGVAPDAICAPASETQAAELILHAIAQKIQLVPYGSGTQQGSSGVPRPKYVALSTRRLNQLVEHEPGDMVATAQAGMELGAFQEQLGARGQWLPISGNPKSTLGGLIATDYSGPLAYGYGTLRDQVLGMRTVNGDGVARKCGGKVVKNVTGFPLEKLYIGSFGTLGLISEVTFKLRPFPVARQIWTTDTTSGFALLKAIDAKNLPLEVLQLDGPSSQKLTVLASGTAKELQRIDADLNACGAAFVRTDLPVQWPANAGLSSVGLPSGASVRFWSLTSALEKCIAAVTQIHSSATYSVNSGGGRIVLPQVNAASATRLSEELAKLGANFRFENLKIEAPFGPPRGDWEVMKRIRASLDPHALFNSGRFVV